MANLMILSKDFDADQEELHKFRVSIGKLMSQNPADIYSQYDLITSLMFLTQEGRSLQIVDKNQVGYPDIKILTTPFGEDIKFVDLKRIQNQVKWRAIVAALG
jgi:hypothetical protein